MGFNKEEKELLIHCINTVLSTERLPSFLRGVQLPETKFKELKILKVKIEKL